MEKQSLSYLYRSPETLEKSTLGKKVRIHANSPFKGKWNNISNYKWNFMYSNLVIAYNYGNMRDFQDKNSWIVRLFNAQIQAINNVAEKNQLFVEILVEKVGLTVHAYNIKGEFVRFLTSSYWVNAQTMFSVTGDFHLYQKFSEEMFDAIPF